MSVSLAILADGRDDWRPDRFERSMFGSRLEFVFPAVKVLDFARHREQLCRNGPLA